MKPIRWGMIGCGDVTEVKSGPGFQKADNSALAAVMRRNGSLAKDYARRHGVPRWYDNAETLINDPEVDAIYIATPPSSHKHYTLLSAAARKPVYVEKPMALNFGECREMINACRSAEVPLFVAYYRRSLDRFLKIKELIDGDAIGEIRFVSIKFYQPVEEEEAGGAKPWRVEPEIAGGGRFVDLASHMLDFLDFALGPIEAVESFAANQGHIYRAEDIVSAAFRFRSGVQGVGTWCFTAFEKHDETEIIGSRGRISYSTFDAEPVRLTNESETQEFAIGYPAHIEQPMIQVVVDQLNGIGNSPSIGDTGARTSWVMDEMLKGFQAET